jgi:hypothetical protein
MTSLSEALTAVVYTTVSAPRRKDVVSETSLFGTTGGAWAISR